RKRNLFVGFSIVPSSSQFRHWSSRRIRNLLLRENSSRRSCKANAHLSAQASPRCEAAGREIRHFRRGGSSECSPDHPSVSSRNRTAQKLQPLAFGARQQR